MTGRIPIETITPTVACGDYPAKAVVGELVPITAVAYRDSHEAMGTNVVWRGPDGAARPFTRMEPAEPGTDRWRAVIRPDAVGLWTFTVEAFADPYLTWRDAILKKVDAGQGPGEVANDLAVGARTLDRVLNDSLPPGAAQQIEAAAGALRDESRPLFERIRPALDLADVLWRHPVRDLVTAGPARTIWVDRKRALYSAWYEFFPRSEGAVVDDSGRPVRHGSFMTAAQRLPAIAKMGFDVVYLPPIHPIGRTNRKGRDNALVARPEDVGSPWAIGSFEGGHDAVHPLLGSVADFRRFVERAQELGLEVALDLALQCAPDHPWVREHPQWFTHLPDGSIAYAENPPKKYQDIYPLNFDNDPEGLREEVLRVVLHWVAAGVKIFRVDNPHTKPTAFWHWLITTVRQAHPDVFFLAEAFTRPAVMLGLGRIGFAQSYTYFTWRNTARELREYCQELLQHADYFRPNFWPNTPDILHETLQHGGPPMFKIRAVLASMLSPSWGIYSGYELCERSARPGTEEYADNEKYQLRPRDWVGAERSGASLAPFIARLNQIRRENPALHWLRNLVFHEIDNDNMLCWSKRDPDSGNTIIVVCSLDPYADHWADVTLNMPALGLDWWDRMTVRDELTGACYDWGQRATVHLDPHVEPAHILTVTARGAAT